MHASSDSLLHRTSVLLEVSTRCHLHNRVGYGVLDAKLLTIMSNLPNPHVCIIRPEQRIPLIYRGGF